jgi:predicted ATPase
MTDRAVPTLPVEAPLEREEELETLASCVAASAAGAPGLVVIEGPAGIGKSRLVGETRALVAASGLRVFTARGSEIEREFPFGIVRQLFESTVHADREALSGSASASRSVFETMNDGSADEEDISFSVLHGLYWLTVNLAGNGPLALVVDDMHWCDRPSLRFLSYLVKRLDGLAVLVVVSLRPSEPGTDAALLAEVSGDALATPLRPRVLTASAAASLVERRLGAQPDALFAEACHASTGGNPLLLTELLKALQAEGVMPCAANVEVVREIGPRAASRAVLVRLGRLSPEAVAAARSLAVLGDGTSLATLAALAEISAAAVAGATAALARAEIIERDTPLRFVHPLVRAAVYHDLSAARA